MSDKCNCCGNVVPEPDIKEAIAREQDWREQFPDGDERVLVCIPCANELKELHGY